MALKPFVIELVVYGILVVAHFFLVLHFLGGSLAHVVVARAEGLSIATTRKADFSVASATASARRKCLTGSEIA